MANTPQYIKDLAISSGKSEQMVSTSIDNAEKQLATSPQKKAYDTAQGNDKEKKYEAYWGAVMLKVRQLLGMPNPKTNIPESKKQIEEDGVTTANMGSPTMATGEKAPYGSSAIFAQRMGMSSRGGSVGMPTKKSKKKKIRESVEYIDSLMEEIDLTYYFYTATLYADDHAVGAESFDAVNDKEAMEEAKERFSAEIKIIEKEKFNTKFKIKIKKGNKSQL